MRLVFAGTPEPALPSLRALAAAGHDIAAVITRADAPLGRKRILTPSPVAVAAEELGLPVIRANHLDAAVTERVAALDAELGVIVAYGGLVREPLLSLPREGWINLHFSLLPRWRGAAPVQRALIAGERTTGASVFRLVPELDAGDLLGTTEYDVPEGTTAGDVLAALADSGASLLADVVADVAAGCARDTAQVGEPTFAPKLQLTDGRISWDLPQRVVFDRIRGVTPEPGAHTAIDGARLKLLEVRPAPSGDRLPPGTIRLIGRDVLIGTADEALQLVRVQPAGKPAMAATDWWRGLRTDEVRVDAPENPTTVTGDPT